MKTQLLAAACLAAFAGAATAAITYVDASTSNTTLANGDPYTPTASLINDDDEWSLRTFGNLGTVYAANDSNADPGEDAPMLRTTITGLSESVSYNIYAYFWGAGNDSPTGNQRWDILAGLDSGNLTFFDTGNATNLGHATTGVDPSSYFTNTSPTVIVAEDDRRLYEAFLGTAVADSNGQIHVFIDDAPGNPNRTWYDGVGYVIPEPGSAAFAFLGLLAFARRRRA